MSKESVQHRIGMLTECLTKIKEVQHELTFTNPKDFVGNPAELTASVLILQSQLLKNLSTLNRVLREWDLAQTFTQAQDQS